MSMIEKVLVVTGLLFFLIGFVSYFVQKYLIDGPVDLQTSVFLMAYGAFSIGWRAWARR